MSTGKNGRSVFARTVLGVMAVALLAAPVGAQAPVPQKALECNSLISIAFGPPTPVAGGSECDVTLTIENALSRDINDIDIDQDFQFVDFQGNCTSTLPCVPDATEPVDFVPGSQSTNCPGMATVTTGLLSPGSVSFDFGAPGFNLGAAPGGICPPGNQPCRCEIFFRVFIEDADAGVPFPTQADTSGVCNIPGFPIGTFVSSAAATAPVAHPVPTLGEMGLAALAALLLAGAWWTLNRRHGSQPAI